jgi:hypothetical protein
MIIDPFQILGDYITIFASGHSRESVKVGEEAPLPPDLRKASGFAGTDRLAFSSPLGWKAQPSSRAEWVSGAGGGRKGGAFPQVRQQSRFGVLPFEDFDATLMTAKRGLTDRQPRCTMDEGQMVRALLGPWLRRRNRLFHDVRP